MLSDIKYIIVSEIDTKQLPDGKWEVWAKLEGKGKNLRECISELSFKQLVASGKLFKAIELDLVEKKVKE